MKIGISVFVSGALLALTVHAHAQENTLGEHLYQVSCATCHGSSGLGDGGFAQYLNVIPSNLTLLAGENDGVFPYLEVFQVVDGRTGVRGHASPPDMPVWGATFKMPIWGSIFEHELSAQGGEYGTELLVRAQLVALVDYVESLQAD